MSASISIAILANASKAKAELNSVQTTAQKVGSGFRNMALPAVAALAGIGKASLDAAKAAAEDESAQSKLAQTLRTAAGASDTQIASTEKWISAQGKALGVSDDELRPALSKLAVATGSVAKAQKLTSLAMDVSAGSGKSLSTVTDALQKAQNGSLGGLSRLGVATKNADGSTKSLAQVTKDLASTYTGAASTAADTTAGKQKKLQVQLGELQEEIGARLLPVLSKMATIGLAAVEWIGENTGKVTALVAVVAGLAAVVITVNVAMTLAGTVMAVYKAAQTAVAAASKAFAAAQWLVNAALSANPIGLVVVAIAALVAGLVIAYQRSETFREIVDAAFAFLKDKIPPILEGIKDVVVKVFNFIKGFISNPIGTIKDVVAQGWTFVKDKTSELWNKVKEIVAEKVADVIEKAKSIKDKIVTFFASAPMWLLNEGRQIVQGIITGLGEKFEALREKLENAKTAITTKFANAANFLLTEGRQIVQGIISGIGEKFEDLASKVGDIRTKITDKFTGAASWLLQTGRDIMSGLVAGLSAAKQWVIDKIQEIAAVIPEWIRKKLGIASPSKVTKKLGLHVGEGLVDGISRKRRDAVKAAKSLAAGVVDGFGTPDLGVTAGLSLDASGALAENIRYREDKRQKISVTLSTPQVSQLQRGREIQMDIDAYSRAGGRARA